MLPQKMSCMNQPKEKPTDRLGLLWRGAAMGVAEVIPGVSGGTIALITGIYERLIFAIRSFDVELVRLLRQKQWPAAWRHVDGPFLLFLLLGMAMGLVAGVFGVTHLLENYPLLLWAFFFGLIVASVRHVAGYVTHWGWPQVPAVVGGTALSYYITVATPAQGIDAGWFIFLCGFIAISALMLPGISGSFMLLLLGMYTTVIPAVKNALTALDPDSLRILAFFAAGALIGLLTFSRVLSWLFKHYHDTTMAVLTGFMIGSLNKLWPWKEVLSWRENSKGELVPFLERSIWPTQYEGDPQVLAVVACMVLGFGLVWLFERLGQGQNTTDA